jgi:hypothetical protein
MTQRLRKHPDLDKLYAICAAIERRDGKGSLPSVRRDSPEWKAWRGWFKERWVDSKWSDAQPGERMMTVAFDYPPMDIDETYKRMVKGRKTNLEEDA